MRNLLAQLHADDSGIITLEYLILATLLALALIVGVHALASAMNSELLELGNAVTGLSQAYSTDGFAACDAFKQGSNVSDTPFTMVGGSDPVAATSVNAFFCAENP